MSDVDENSPDESVNEEPVKDAETPRISVNPQSTPVDLLLMQAIDATVTASMDLGGKPKLTVKRAWSF